MNDRILDENGNFVSTSPKQKHDPRDKAIEVLKQELKNMMSSYKQRGEEINSLKTDINESNPLGKQKVLDLEKENAKLRLEIEVLLEKEKQGEACAVKVLDLEQEVKVLNEELTLKHNASKSKGVNAKPSKK